MSVKENETLARRYLNAFLTGDVDDVAEYMTPDAELLFPGFDEEGNYGLVALFIGAEGYKEATQGFRAFMPDTGGTIDEVIVTEDKAVLRYTVHGTFKGGFQGIQPTGKQTQFVAIDILHFANGQITKALSVWDEMRGWQQLGLLPGLPYE